MLEVSGLDWSIVRATMLTDKPFTGQVHIELSKCYVRGSHEAPIIDGIASAFLSDVRKISM